METIQNYAQFLELAQKDIIVVIAKTKQCNVCVPVSKRLEEILASFPQVPLFQIYLEDVPEFQGQQLIFTVPTIVIFSEGREILRESRFVDFLKIERLLTLYTE